MIDLHCHMLPGIDDGPKTMDQSLAMARFAVDQGIHRCVVTPHIQPGCYDNNKQTIKRIFESFQKALLNEGIDLELGMSAEVRVCAELPMMIKQDMIPFLGCWQGRRVILLEFPHDHIPVGSDKLVKWLINQNILPLIAHPERNQAIQRQTSKLKVFMDMGCLLQITADSVTGLFGEQSQKCALEFIENDQATLIATDAHNLQKRKPTLLSARDFLLPRIGHEHVERLLFGNPASLLA